MERREEEARGWTCAPIGARARIYDYILGGKDNFAVDREAGENSLKIWPALRVHMRANRFFMHRVARYLAAEQGIRQFLDIGTGLPPGRTCTRSCRRSTRPRRWSTPTTTRWCSHTPAR